MHTRLWGAAALSLIVVAAGTAFSCTRAPQQKAEAPARDSKSAAAPARDPQAMTALQRMGDYLRTLRSFELRTKTTIEEPISNGQKLEFAGTALYRIRRPDAFFIETTSDRAIRQYFYDGRAFTVYAPRQDFYATIAAPPTIRETVDKIYREAGIALPLADLFYWSEANAPTDRIASATRVGYARVDGVDTDQYAFRGEETDWQIWIERGARPLPRRIVIVSKNDPAQPEYAATLSWNLSPRLAANSFGFRPDREARPIALAGVAEATPS
jgi:hypothetical protein